MDSDPPARPPRPAPRLNPEAARALAARQQREAAALRENLRRRKQQARARATPDEAEDAPCP